MRVETTDRGRLWCLSPQARRLPAARYSAKVGGWIFPPSRVAREMLDTWGATYSENALEALTFVRTHRARPFPQVFEARPAYEHQRRGREFMFNREAAAVFAEPGTGKTRMVVDTYVAKKSLLEVDALLVLCPVSVRAVWMHELRIWGAVESTVVAPTNPWSQVVCGIESLSSGRAYDNCIKFMHEHRRVMVVVDEAHTIKNSRALRTRRATDLGRAAASRYILTGTPVTRTLVDLYSQFNFLDPAIIGYPDLHTFEQRYVQWGGYEQRQIVGYKFEQELIGAIAPHTFRATKAECLDLPPKVYTRRNVELPAPARAAYTALRKTGVWGSCAPDGPLELALRLHQITGGLMPDGSEFVSPKIAALLDVVADSGGTSTIVWCRYLHEVRAVVAALEPLGAVVQIHGEVAPEDRAKAVAAMQEGRARFLVGTAASGGVGITVTAATQVVYFSNSWSYVDRVQSEDRAHRAGQTRTVTVVDLVCAKTIDEDILAALGAKQDLSTYLTQSLNSDKMEVLQETLT
jgi:SNF2-related domain/Helicase conserved C-terminal domain